MSLNKKAGTFKQRVKKLGKKLLSEMAEEDKSEALITNLMRDRMMDQKKEEESKQQSFDFDPSAKKKFKKETFSFANSFEMETTKED